MRLLSILLSVVVVLAGVGGFLFLQAAAAEPEWAALRLDGAPRAPPSWEEARTWPTITKFVVRDDRFATPHAEGGPAPAVRGSGTLGDPYVLERLHVTRELAVVDTDACIVVRDVYLSGSVEDGTWRPARLRLDWNGPCVHVHSSHIGELRVNGNHLRSGYATGGLIEGNDIVVVGQLRHFDGVFAANTVGDPETPDAAAMRGPRDRVANVDGFNEAQILSNTFHGGVDLDLHGHHHGEGFFSPHGPAAAATVHSHYHGHDAARQVEHEDHTDRWISVRFAGNTVHGTLRYEDLDHAADDRQAASESLQHDGLNPLNAPHRHHTRVTLAENTVTDLVVQVFNAPGIRLWDAPGYPAVHHFKDVGHCEAWHREHQRPVQACLLPGWEVVPHPTLGTDLSRTVDSHIASSGELWITGNTVTGGQRAAVLLVGVRDARVHVLDNTLTGPVGVAVRESDGTFTLEGNSIDAALCGIRVDDSHVKLRLDGNDVNARQVRC